jgi:putative glutathione S-transferase
MGMVVDGRWVEDADTSNRNGAFVRASSTFDHDVPEAAIAEIVRASGRYVIVASLSCPWSHRVLLVRALKQIDEGLPVQIACGPRIEGYGLSTAGPLTGAVDQNLRHVHQLYTKSDPRYRGRATVPILWDAQDNRIVSNDSARIMRALDTVDGTEGFTLFPGPHAGDIDALNATIHTGLANAVYRAGLAQTQDAYDAAVGAVFATLGLLEKRLSDSRYLFGTFLAETDLRLFATLVRFDAVYATHFRCTRHRLTDYPNLWDYARDLFGWRDVAETVDFDVILDGYYTNDGVHNPFRIIADAPQVDWREPTSRDRFGAAQLWSRQAGPMNVNPETLQTVTP